MARPKSFDPQEVIEKSMSLFWRKGYTNTSLSDLENKTGLKRISLYHEFGSKEGLFLKCIDTYIEKMLQDIEQYLGKEGINGIIGRFQRFTGENPDVPEQLPFGCMMINHTIESPELSNAIRKRVKKGYDLLTGEYKSTLTLAKKQGQISKNIDSNSNAKLLVAILSGILVQVRLQKDVYSARDSAKEVIKMIESWKIK